MAKRIFNKAIAIVKNGSRIEIERKVVNPNEAKFLRDNSADCSIDFNCAGTHNGIDCNALLTLKNSPRGIPFFSSRNVEDHIDGCSFGAQAKSKKRSSVANLNNCSLDFIPNFRIQGEVPSSSVLVSSSSRNVENAERNEGDRIEEFSDVPVEYVPSKKLNDNAEFYDRCGVNSIIDKSTRQRVKETYYFAKTRQYYKNGELEFVPGRKMMIDACRTGMYHQLDSFIVGKGYRNSLVLVDDSVDASVFFVVLFPNRKKYQKALELVVRPAQNTKFLFAGDILAVDKEVLPGHTVVAIGVAVSRNFVKKKTR